MFVRLKEPTFQQELLRQVVATANRHRALQFLVLVFESAEEVEAVRDMGLWQGKIMRAFPVRSHPLLPIPTAWHSRLQSLLLRRHFWTPAVARQPDESVTHIMTLEAHNGPIMDDTV